MRRPPPLLPLIALLLLLLAGAAGPAGAKDVPPLTGRVVDQANLLSPEQRQRIEAQLVALEKQTGDQVAVLTVDSLDGDPIEDFANKTGRAWALGQKGKNNGVILLVAKQDRKMRIEVGYGLEPQLTDLQTNIIQTQIIIPHFKQGDFGGGIEAGVDALVTTLQGKPLATPAAQQPDGDGGSQSWPGLLIFALFALGPFILNAIRSGSWIVYIVVLPILFFLGSLASTVVGLVAAGIWLILFPILRMVLPKTPSSGRFRGPGGWWMGGPGGWGGGGGRGGWGGGGGGGFSGGGGSFGGGGSSSSW